MRNVVQLDTISKKRYHKQTKINNHLLISNECTHIAHNLGEGGQPARWSADDTKSHTAHNPLHAFFFYDNQGSLVDHATHILHSCQMSV